MEFQISSINIIKLGVISDTHVPDRVGELHPEVLPNFREHQVDYIVHAGDVCSLSVIKTLEDIAPVVHVTGNRDFLMRKERNRVLFIRVNGVLIGITHGHGGLLPYFWDKLPYLLVGYKFQRYQKKLDKIVNNAEVVIYGHTHTSENRWVNGRLYFNSGSAYDRGKDGSGPSLGILTISPLGEIKSSIIPLEYMSWSDGKWKKQPNLEIKQFES